MAIVNVTTDSFSGDGHGSRLDQALAHADRAIEEGADLLDIGGESTRPGADAVPLQQELDHVIPLVERLRDCPVPLSVDTLKPAVMREAIAAGAAMINDVNAFRAEGAVAAVAASGAALCVMHMQGEPRTMQHNPSYADVEAEVRAFLDERVATLQAAGVVRARLLLDPGFGFGKSVAHNYTLLAGLGRLAEGGLPLLAGLSRKSMLGAVTGRPAGQRVAASVAAALVAVQRGAAIVRVHDVAATADMLKVWEAVREAEVQDRVSPAAA
ncbi:MAG: dihydropteroate synthase [Rhodocyclaceae bacterium]|jgi:dihydropteroate synthase|nr:dihydropteroate synthase [Rhodocyclaceae bacterium]